LEEANKKKAQEEAKKKENPELVCLDCAQLKKHEKEKENAETNFDPIINVDLKEQKSIQAQ
jgi:hypothetical protein